MNVNALGGSNHPHNLRTTHLYARGEADTAGIPTTGATPTGSGSDEQPITAEALDSARGRRAEQMAERDVRFADRLSRMAQHRMDKVGEKLERIAAHHGLEGEQITELEATFTTAVDALAEQLADEGFQPGAVAEFRHGVHGALADLRAGVRELIADGGSPVQTEDEPADSAAPGTIDGDITAAPAVTVATDPVAETTDGTSVGIEPASNDETAPMAAVGADVDRVELDLSDAALGLDVMTDIVRIADAFSLDDTGPSIDIRA